MQLSSGRGAVREGQRSTLTVAGDLRAIRKLEGRASLWSARARPPRGGVLGVRAAKLPTTMQNTRAAVVGRGGRQRACGWEGVRASERACVRVCGMGTCLAHEVVDDAVEREPVVEACLGQVCKVGGGDWQLVNKELSFEIALEKVET